MTDTFGGLTFDFLVKMHFFVIYATKMDIYSEKCSNQNSFKNTFHTSDLLLTL